MKMAMKKTNNKSTSTARVVDGKLILSYPDAINPVVWQMDLVQAKASALEVREAGKGTFMLALKTPKGESTEIAPFSSKEQAVDALMAASRALENAQGQIRPAESNNVSALPPQQKQKGSKGSKLAATGLGLLLIVILFGIWSSLVPRPPVSVDSQGLSPNPAANFGSRGDENGVPLSADEFLMKNRKQ